MTTFVITAGHSATDPGAVANGHKEAELAVQLRDIIRTKLEALGHTVVCDGVKGENKDLRTAISLIPQGKAAVEIHFNAASSNSAKGVETISLPKDKVISQKLSKAVAAVLGTTVRGDNGWIDQTKSARGKLGYVNAGGMILEIAFLTNPVEMSNYDAKYYLVATAIVEVLTTNIK